MISQWFPGFDTVYDVLSVGGGREMISQWFPGFDTV